MIVAINYADEPYRLAQQYNTKTAYKRGKVDKVIEYGPQDLDQEYRKKHAYAFVLNDKRVGKYGLWRPHILLDAFEQIQEGDYLIYSDSGCYYKNNVQYLIDFMEAKKEVFLTFNSEHAEKNFTKRDIFLYMDCDKPEYTDTLQRISTYFIIKKCDKTKYILEEYKKLTYEAPYLFTDEQNRLGKENYKGFIDTRHNQSVLSLLTKKNGIGAYKAADQWGKGCGLKSSISYHIKQLFHRNDYPVIFFLHRHKYVNWKVKAQMYFKNLFPNVSRLLKDRVGT